LLVVEVFEELLEFLWLQYGADGQHAGLMTSSR